MDSLRRLFTYILSLKPKAIYAWANLLLNPWGVLVLLYPLLGPEAEPLPAELFWIVLIWIVLSSLANGLARDMVHWVFSTLWDLSLNGVAKFGFIGFLIIAVLFASLGTFLLAGVLVILWIYAWTILAPER